MEPPVGWMPGFRLGDERIYHVDEVQIPAE
jgi:hypothetical protein